MAFKNRSCEQCGKSYKPTGARQRLCGNPCKRDTNASRASTSKRPRATDDQIEAATAQRAARTCAPPVVQSPPRVSLKQPTAGGYRVRIGSLEIECGTFEDLRRLVDEFGQVA